MDTYLIPENLDLDKILKENPPAFKFKKEKFLYILHLLTEIPGLNKEFVNREFIPIYSPRLQRMVHDYAIYLKYLLENHVIETDNHYVKKERSKGYRFAEKYRTPVKEIPITDYVLGKKIKNYKTGKFFTKVYPKLRRYFNPNLRIDEMQAVEYLKYEYAKDVQEKVPNAAQKYNVGLLTVKKFAEQEYHFSVDPIGHRLHTNLTNMRSGLRKFISYNGQTLISVDIKNSQPLLSAILLSQGFYTADATTQFSLKYINSIITNPLDIKPLPKSLHIMLEEYQESTDNTGISDITRYKELVQNGILYEYISEALKTQNPPINLSRAEVKKIFFTILFSDNRFIGTPEAYPKRLFRDLFPHVYEIFSHIKRTAHNNLAILLQNIESHFILDIVANRIIKERPDLPIYTIHDSLITTRGNEEYVSTIVCDEMLKYFGFRPKLKIEPWDPNNITSTIKKESINETPDKQKDD